MPCVAVAIWTPILPLGLARTTWLEESSLTYESESAWSPWSPWIMMSFDIKPLDMVMSGSVSPSLWTAMMFRVALLNKVIAGCPLLSSIVRLLHSIVSKTPVFLRDQRRCADGADGESCEHNNGTEGDVSEFLSVIHNRGLLCKRLLSLVTAFFNEFLLLFLHCLNQLLYLRFVQFALHRALTISQELTHRCFALECDEAPRQIVRSVNHRYPLFSLNRAIAPRSASLTRA